MCNSAVSPNKPCRRAAGITVSLRCAAVLLITFFPLSAAGTQTQDAAASFRSLQEAVEAIREGRLQQAEAALNSILAAMPRDPDALNLLGVVRAQQRREGEAENLFQRSLAASPSHVGTRLNLAELYVATGRPQQALQVLLAAHRLAPGRADVNLKLAALHANRREYESALQYLRLVSHPDADAEYFPLQLKCLLGLKRLEEARRLALDFKESGAGDAEGQADFAMLLAGGGLGDEALDLLEAARGRAPESFPVLYALGVINAAAKQYGKAEEYLSASLRLKHDDVASLRALARVTRSTRNFEKALASLVQARRIAPDDPGVLYDFGATALEMNLYLDALPVFERLRRLSPREPAYIYALAAAHFRGGELAEAVSLLKSYVVLRPQDAAGFYLLGAALHSLNQFAGARVALERSLKLKPDPDAEYLLGVDLYDEGNRAAAIETLRRVVIARPDNAAAHTALGSAYREQGDYNAARSTLERAVQLNAKDLRAHYQLGLVYAKLGDKDAAKRMLDRAEELRGAQRDEEKIILKLADPPENDPPTAKPPG